MKELQVVFQFHRCPRKLRYRLTRKDVLVIQPSLLMHLKLQCMHCLFFRSLGDATHAYEKALRSNMSCTHESADRFCKELTALKNQASKFEDAAQETFSETNIEDKNIDPKAAALHLVASYYAYCTDQLDKAIKALSAKRSGPYAVDAHFTALSEVTSARAACKIISSDIESAYPSWAPDREFADLLKNLPQPNRSI